ncbi:DNA mismatch repair protein MutS, partial [Pavlovales sp. CCMP2436]
SGKSVYLKQVAIAVYLAHVGSFVPAKFARIGLTDRIQTRVFSRETAAIAKSTFMFDLHQAALMLTASTERTLLILDEFGK